MTKFAATQIQFALWAKSAQQNAAEGKVNDRISHLAQSDPCWFAVQVDLNNRSYSFGDSVRPFSLMSVIKPFVLLYLLEHYGSETVFQWVGVEPSDAPFNAIEQLVVDQGRPRNPMINSGAIVLADKLPGATASDRCQSLCQWLNQQAGCRLRLDEEMLASVRSAGNAPNQAIVQILAAAQRINQPTVTLDTYEQICCLSSHVLDLAKLGQLLAHQGQIAQLHRQTVNALMLTCGLYEASGAMAVRIGLPMKSGISGALLAIVPDQGAIACYSPTLDRSGNSIAGLALVESLSQGWQLSLFG